MVDFLVELWHGRSVTAWILITYGLSYGLVFMLGLTAGWFSHSIKNTVVENMSYKPIPLPYRIQRVKNRIDKLKELDTPAIVIQNEERILKRMENDLKVLEERKKGA